MKIGRTNKKGIIIALARLDKIFRKRLVTEILDCQILTRRFHYLTIGKANHCKEMFLFES